MQENHDDISWDVTVAIRDASLDIARQPRIAPAPITTNSWS